MHHTKTSGRIALQTLTAAVLVVGASACAYGMADPDLLRARDSGAAPDAHRPDAGVWDPRLVDAGGADARVADAGGADAHVADASRPVDASIGVDAGVAVAIACGASFCRAGEVCVLPCCGGPPPPADCAPGEPCAARVDHPCDPPPPFCVPAAEAEGCTGHSGGLLCAPCVGGVGLYDPVTSAISCVCA